MHEEQGSHLEERKRGRDDVIACPVDLEVGRDLGEHDVEHQQVVAQAQPFAQPRVHLASHLRIKKRSAAGLAWHVHQAQRCRTHVCNCLHPRTPC